MGLSLLLLEIHGFFCVVGFPVDSPDMTVLIAIGIIVPIIVILLVATSFIRFKWAIGTERNGTSYEVPDRELIFKQIKLRNILIR